MKVGQWARFTVELDDTETEMTFIKQIENVGYDEDYASNYVETFGYLLFPCNIIKTTDNLVDLLEVGDIVHYKYIKSNYKTQTILTSKPVLLDVKSSIKKGTIKITAIELHENRVKQEVTL